MPFIGSCIFVICMNFVRWLVKYLFHRGKQVLILIWRLFLQNVISVSSSLYLWMGPRCLFWCQISFPFLQFWNRGFFAACFSSLSKSFLSASPIVCSGLVACIGWDEVCVYFFLFGSVGFCILDCLSGLSCLARVKWRFVVLFGGESTRFFSRDDGMSCNGAALGIKEWIIPDFPPLISFLWANFPIFSRDSEPFKSYLVSSRRSVLAFSCCYKVGLTQFVIKLKFFYSGIEAEPNLEPEVRDGTCNYIPLCFPFKFGVIAFWRLLSSTAGVILFEFEIPSASFVSKFIGLLVANFGLLWQFSLCFWIEAAYGDFGSFFEYFDTTILNYTLFGILVADWFVRVNISFHVFWVCLS